MVYIVYGDVNNLTNLTSSDISNADLTTLISYATCKVNADIGINVIREPVGYIDSTRENSIDSSNTAFYVQNWKGKYIIDLDDDGDVDTSDITVYQVDSDGTETELTVSSITHNEGKFVLSSAPSPGVSLYVTYRWSYADCSTPETLVKLACIYLTSALAYEKINAGKSPQVVFGNTRFLRHMEASNVYYRKYIECVNQINRRFIAIKESKEIF